ncbi:MAG: murein transglycosylase A [Kiloniellaceae bacterium]
MVVAALAAVLLSACEEKPQPEVAPEKLRLTPVSFDQVPGWRADRLSEALPALARSCARLSGQPEERAIGPGRVGIGGRVADWRPVCAVLAEAPAGDDSAARAYFEAWFVPFRASSGDRDTGLFTGYYEAELRGAPVPGGAYRVPLYRRPPDRVTVDLGLFRADFAGERIIGRVEDGSLLPYHTREEIDAGTLAGRNLELLWADDPVDVFFLHVQGSGRVLLPDGSAQRVGFAASNGRAFTGIGRVLIEEGKISRNNASMQAIRDWLRAHPREAWEIMRRNARYIFFRKVDGDGPIGAQGVPLTAGRSLAVDPAFLPLGVPVFLDTTWPGGDRPLRRLMVAQDTGGAIKGPLRGDFFWGSGEPALEFAGRMRQQGAVYLLLPKTVAARRRATS